MTAAETRSTRRERLRAPPAGLAHARHAVEEFCSAIRAAGIEPPDKIESDGKLHRFTSSGKRGDDAGWYVLHDDGIPAGAFGCWRSGVSETWRADIGRKLTPSEDEAHRARVEAMRRGRELEDARRKAEARENAAAIWQAATPPADHGYLARKGIKAHGARLHNGALLIPMRDADGALQSLQFIGPDGDKKFLSGGRVKGCYFAIGATKGAAALAICEGFATGATIHEATGYPVACAMNAGNLEPAARALRAKFPDVRLILCADDDSGTEGNPGSTKATAAARAVGGLVAIPDFGANRPADKKDFNDLHQIRGREAVESAIASASAPAREVHQPYAADAAGRDPAGTEWPEPLPLVAKVEPEPYPLDALPAKIRAAVEEVQAFTKAPASLVAASALGALSVAAQALQDVKRAEKLQGPSGLFLLTIADSGERKTTCDAFFTAAIREYEQEQAEAAKPTLARYAAEISAWEAEYEGIRAAIKQAGKTGKPAKGKSIDALRAELAELENSKPQAPRVPNLIRNDDTPENLAWVLAKKWPSAGVMSSEAGAVLGAHGMGKDSIMRNLALLNILWDGGTLKIGRRTSESFTVRGARFTMALQVQEVTLQNFFDKSDGLARGTGFLSRFLVAWPASTQGARPFTEAPQAWPALAVFHRRIRALLDTPTPLDTDGALSPALISLTPDAKVAWVAFHDAIEAELRNGGELFDVKDVAAKAADNAARLAALFQIFEHGAGGAVGLEAFDGASRIAAWHLNESRRFFGELALPVELANAVRLDAWLIEHCRRERTHIVPRRKIQQNVTPSRLREKAALSEALRELADAGRIREVSDGRRKEILVNPALLAQGAA